MRVTTNSSSSAKAHAKREPRNEPKGAKRSIQTGYVSIKLTPERRSVIKELENRSGRTMQEICDGLMNYAMEYAEEVLETSRQHVIDQIDEICGS